MDNRRHWLRFCKGAPAGVLAILLALLPGRNRAAARPQNGASAGAAEVTSHDSQPALQLHVQHNEVVVRVIVRDSGGRFVTNLGQKDFEVFDNGKQQVITHFAVEKAAAAPRAAAQPPGAAAPTPAGARALPVITLPNRFLALYFDDIHLELGDLMIARNAADHYLSSTLHPGDRAAIFTSSGQNQVDFTDDRQKLHDDLMALRPRSLYKTATKECPDISPYQAYQMVDLHDQYAMQIAYEEAFECYCEQSDPQAAQMCRAQMVPNMADSASVRVLESSLQETNYALNGLELICRRMVRLPGQRTIVLVSPGFITRTQEPVIDQIVDRALRDNIVISSLDARGLYVELPAGDATQHGVEPIQQPALMGWKNQFRIEEMSTDADVLEEMANETGGVYFHNSNDLQDGFLQTGTFPQTFFTLAFAPQNLKLDGRLHSLKVKLAENPGRYSLQFRKGYFAPDKAQDAATVAKEELTDMVYSQDEVRTIPIEIHTQFFKADAGNARLSVVTHVDVGTAKFSKADGRNVDHMVLLTAVFDRGGNYVIGQEKTIDFKLFDSTLTKLLQSGLNVRSTLSVKPGTYLVREVVADSGSDQMSALNSTVEIPE